MKPSLATRRPLGAENGPTRTPEGLKKWPVFGAKSIEIEGGPIHSPPVDLLLRWPRQTDRQSRASQRDRQASQTDRQSSQTDPDRQTQTPDRARAGPGGLGRPTVGL